MSPNDQMTIPHSAALEQAVLGDILIDPGAYHLAAEVLVSGSFYIHRNRWVWEAMSALAERGEAIDFITITGELENEGHLEEIGGSAYIAELIEATPTSVNVESHVKQLAALAERRRLIHHSLKVMQSAHDHDIPVEDTLAQFQALSTSTDAGGQSLQSLVDDLFGQVEVWASDPLPEGQVRGLATGIRGVDVAFGGLKAGLYIVAGRTSMGKTALALQIASNVARAGGGVLVWTLEMGRSQIAARLACMHGRVEWHKVEAGHASPEELQRLFDAYADLVQWPITLHDAGVKPGNILARAKRALVDGPVDLLVIDSLNLMSGANRESNRNYELGSISRDLLMMAKSLDIPILATHQISRQVEARQNKRPLLADLRDSGEIEQQADGVMMVYRPAYYETTSREKADHLSFYRGMNLYLEEHDLDRIVEIIIRKDRLGAAAGTYVLMYWDKRYARFETLQRGEQ
jgi:replicative DNA helicase